MYFEQTHTHSSWTREQWPLVRGKGVSRSTISAICSSTPPPRRYFAASLWCTCVFIYMDFMRSIRAYIYRRSIRVIWFSVAHKLMRAHSVFGISALSHDDCVCGWRSAVEVRCIRSFEAILTLSSLPMLYSCCLMHRVCHFKSAQIYSGHRMYSSHIYYWAHAVFIRCGQ